MMKIALQKFIKGGIKTALGALLTFLAAHQIDINSWGIGIDPDLFSDAAAVLAVGVLGGLFEAIRNWLKRKKGIGWL